MATITSSVGTATRDYATLTTWEADVYNSATNTDAVIAELYNDSNFVDAPNLADTTPTDIKVTVAAGEEHDGTAGTGARWVQDGSTITGFTHFPGTGPDLIFEKFEYDANANIVEEILTLGRSAAGVNDVTRLLIHGLDDGSATSPKFALKVNEYRVTNCIIYDCKTSAGGGRDIYGLIHSRAGRDIELFNLTIDFMRNDNGSGDCHPIRISDTSGPLRVAKNCVGTGTGGTSTGTKEMFYGGVANWTPDTNITDRSTIAGINGITSITRANQYVSTTIGSEDYHVQDTAANIYHGVNVALDVGNTNNAHVDIDGRDRDAEGDTWDFGADQFVGVVAGPAAGLRTLALTGVGV